jgi:ABC-type phosphate transport system auxiliary subunit
LAQNHESVLQRQIDLYKRQLEGVEIALKASHLDESLSENALFDNMAVLEGLERQQRDIETQMNSLEFDD